MIRTRGLLESLYSQSRGGELRIDRDLSDSDLNRFAMRMAMARVRGYFRRLPGIYVGKGVVLRNRRRLVVEGNVSIGDYVLLDSLGSSGIDIAAGVTIDSLAVLRCSGGIRRIGVGIVLGQRTAVGYGNFIHGGGGVSIGENCLLGPYVQIFSENHRFSDTTTPIIEQGESPAPVVVEDDCWIGAGSILLAGAVIGRGAVVAAGSVVTGSVAPNSVVGGIPARPISKREGVR